MLEAFDYPVTINFFFRLLSRYIIDKSGYFMKALEVGALLTECLHSHMELRRVHVKQAFYERMRSEYNGLVRPQLETFLFEEIGVDHVNESHRVLY